MGVLGKRDWIRRGQHALIALVIFASLFLVPIQPAKAAADLSITPITWNVIGLDSNNVNVGPNHFPVGVRVCNDGDLTATNVKSAFQFESGDPFTGDPYINLRPGTKQSYTADGIDLAPTDCVDFYYEVEVTRDANAYDNTREYYISATADGGLSVETEQPRELYVEYLISQSRNSTEDIYVNGTLVDPGGTMTLMVGQTYTIVLEGFTATNGYEQIESFINFPNTIFQVLSVSTDYTADTSAYVTDPDDKLYGDGCLWENEPTNPNYRSCLETGKAGGDIVITYQVKILEVPSAPLLNPQSLSTLIYDFSGSSYHYNADYSVSTRYARIVNATVEKSFSPKAINPGEDSTLTFTVTNPGPDPIANVNFTDNLPAGISINNAGITYSGCGSPSPASFTIGDTSLPFTGITVAGYGTCTIAVTISGSTENTYNNTSNNLFIDTDDTGSFAEDTLLITSQPPAPSSCASPVTMATWTMPTSGQGSGGPPPPYTTLGPDVLSASTSSSGGTPSIETGGVTTNAWQIFGGWNTIDNPPTSTSTPYFEFTVDSSNYGGVRIQLAYHLDAEGDWASGNNNYIYIHTQADSDPFSSGTSYLATKGSWQSGVDAISHNAATSGVGTTTFRINALGAPSNKPNAAVLLDDIIISGCPRPDLPTLSKAFGTDPITVGATSTLVFTINNPNASQVLSGMAFFDTLPTGLEIASPNGLSTTCNGTVTAVPGTTLIDWSGGSLAGSGSCTIAVNVLGAAAGEYTNISGSISSTESGTNTTGTGYGTDTITVIAPPVISKGFSANSILTSATTDLTFTIENPNLGTTLTGISFIDTLPAGVDLVAGSSAQCGGTMTLADNAPAQDTVALSAGTLPPGGSCTFSVTVTGSTVGLKTNTVTVSSTNGGTGNTASANLLVKAPSFSFSLTKRTSDSATGDWTPFLAVYPGDNIYYRFLIENTGDVALTNVGVNDPTVDTSSCVWVDGDSTPNTIPLNPDNTFSLAAPAPGSEAHIAICVLGPFTALTGTNINTAQAYSTEIPLGSPDTPEDSATYIGIDPSLSLLKEISTAAGGPWSSSITSVSAGSDLYYRFSVTNTGNIPLTSIAITDPTVDASGCSFTPDPLATSATATCVVGPISASTTIGTYPNTASATAEGQPPYDPAPGTTYTSNQSTASYTLASPNLTITKSNDTADVGAAGVTFNWNLLIQNYGDQVAVFTDGQTILTDTLPAGPTYASPVAGNYTNITNPGNISCGIVLTTLTCTASGADVTIGTAGSFTVTWSVTPADGSTLVNAATVDPDDLIEESDETDNDDTDTVNVAALTLVKSISSGSPYAAVNDVINYSFLVTNTGNVSLAGPVTIADDQATDESCPAVTTQGNNDGNLDPGESLTCTASYTVTQADLNAGSVVNVASASADGTTSPTDTETATATQSPALTLVKEASDSASGPWVENVTVPEGDPVYFRVVVSNTGNVDLTTVSVTDDECTLSLPSGDTNSNSILETTESWTYTCSVTAIAGTTLNTATADTAETSPQTDTASYFGQQGSLGVTKSSPTISVSAVGQIINYDYVVSNTGPITLTNVTLADDNTDSTPVCIPAQPFTLLPGAVANCTAQHTVTVGEFVPGTNVTNTATAESDQTGPVQTTLDIPVGVIFDPPFGYKDYDDSGLPALRWTMVWINDSNIAELDAEVFDPIPAGTTFLGGLVCSEDGPNSTTSLCTYNAGTNQIEWAGTIYPDPGATTAADADNEIVITFLVSVPDTLTTAVNQATLNADLNNDGSIVIGDGEVAVADAQAVWSRSLPSAPDTGFAPDVVTSIPAQTLDKGYLSLGSVWLEIPRLGITKGIVGVPIVENDWDVTWLHDKAGWLAGTAFPSHSGNSVITGHVFLPSGLPGPFVDLKNLAWDDQIIIHAFGRQYIYKVRVNQVILPDDPLATKHEEYPWVTLLTCKGYNDSTEEYDYRIMIRGVLVDVKPDY